MWMGKNAFQGFSLLIVRVLRVTLLLSGLYWLSFGTGVSQMALPNKIQPMEKKKLSFVVIDDCPDYEKIQSDLIRALGHEAEGIVITARHLCNGFKSVVERILELRPDGIIADQNLVDVCGSELVRRVKKRFKEERLKSPIVIASSGNLTREMVDVADLIFLHKRRLLYAGDKDRMISWHFFGELIENLARKLHPVSSSLRSSPKA